MNAQNLIRRTFFRVVEFLHIFIFSCICFFCFPFPIDSGRLHHSPLTMSIVAVTQLSHSILNHLPRQRMNSLEQALPAKPSAPVAGGLRERRSIAPTLQIYTSAHRVRTTDATEYNATHVDQSMLPHKWCWGAYASACPRARPLHPTPSAN